MKIVRNRVGTDSIGEDKQDSREDSRGNPRNGDTEEDLPLRSIENRSGFLEVGIPVFKDITDHPVGEGSVVDTKDERCREETFRKPGRTMNAPVCKDTIGFSFVLS